MNLEPPVKREEIAAAKEYGASVVKCKMRIAVTVCD